MPPALRLDNISAESFLPQKWRKSDYIKPICRKRRLSVHPFKSRLLLVALLGAAPYVFAANLAPTFVPIGAQTVAEGGTLSFTASATDPEGLPVTLTAGGLKTWMSFSGNTFTAKPTLNNAGSYSITFNATDGSHVTKLTVSLTVSNTNQVPTLSTLTNRTVNEGSTLALQVTASDPDKDAVTITASGMKPWMSYIGTTFSITPGYVDSGAYTVTFTASDGKLSSQGSMTVTVTNVNQAPVFGTITPPTVAEGASLSLPIVATDPDGAAVTLSATGIQSAWMSFDGAKLTATPDHDKAGSYAIVFTATDGLKQTQSSVTLTVTDTNRAPVLNPIGVWSVGEGKVLSLPVSASDADGVTPTVTATGLKSWMSFDGKAFRARPGVGNNGTYLVTFSASDGKLTVTDTATVNVTLDDSAFPPPWTHYFGSQWTGAGWAGLERAWLGYLTGMNAVDQPGVINTLTTEVQARLVARDVIVTIEGFGGGGGIGSPMTPFMDLINGGGVATWQDAVKSQVLALAPLDPTGARIVYQLGNEISKETTSGDLRAWALSRGFTIPGVSQDYDPELLPYYVEYYLAPTVEAATQASQTGYGNPDTVTLALGSIGNGGTANARTFLDLLLNYTIQGTYAPTLSGKRVNEIIDLVTVHYVGSSANLDLIWDKWKNVGSIRGLWTTETVGIRAAEDGRGAGVAINELDNNLGWYYNRGLQPAQARVSYYGWDTSGLAVGTAADTSMTEFYNFFGAVPLEIFANLATITGSTADLQTHLYNAVNDANKRVVTVVATTDTPLSSTLASLAIPKAGWTGKATATVHFFSPAGHSVSTPSVVESSSSYTLTLNPAITLTGNGDGVMITFQR